MMDDRPIIFTVTENKIYTKDGRITDIKKEYPLVATNTKRKMFEVMETITRYGNKQGYAVLFEVD